MTPADIATLLAAEFGPAITGTKLDALDPFVTVAPASLPAVCQFLCDDPRLKFEILNDISGVDYLEIDPKKLAKAGFEPHLEVVYHLSSFSFPGRRFTLKVVLPRWKNDAPGELPEVPTVAGVWRTADWQEREVFDLLGITFVGHPDPRRILLADDWVGHPLRKDYEYPLEYHGIRCR
ncbi:NADH-quinone oxidoreductase subunit C [Fimbriiglobus ruber]|uniref:NADH-quinone oxidoreductase subunit C n=1 Tax=Fimbriiglobus ruber TaxID=1908690 RepID=A0A225DRX0_9BACT|nr:NADH-quinone oxidoreductase subunit C [Fimbriiglobus ruber]OWK38847.1 NADH-ubiquinone oxidoreductase chain C [Fimbriiglobus ruber]